MAQPPLYSRQYSFTAFQQQNPSSPLPAQQVDIELNAVRASLNAAIGNLGLVQRDDGRLANNSVAMESIQPAVRLLLGAGWTPRGAWAPNTAYVVGNVVSEAGSTYVCNAAHTSQTTFAASSAFWTTLFTVAPPPSTSYPEPLVADTGRFLVATAAGASAWQTLTVPLASSTTTGVLPLVKGGTGATDASAARTALGVASAAATTAAQTTADNALTAANNRVAKAGDTMTGFLTLHADPTSPTHAATKQYVDGAVGNVVRRYTSPDQTFVNGGTVTLAHGLGGMPDGLSLLAVCQTADLGYSPGQLLFLPTWYDDTTSVRIAAVSPTATNLDVRWAAAATLVFPRFDNGTRAAITLANWRIRFVAWRFV